MPESTTADGGTQPDPVAADETRPDPSGKTTGAMIEVQDHRWEASPLALLSDDDFERRLILMKKEISRLRRIRRDVMEEGHHYGTIPGTDKPSLFQPGAQLLNNLQAYESDYTYERILGDGILTPHITYVVTCTLLSGAGKRVGQGIGAATSWEKKHRYRYAEKVCPACGVATIRRAKKDDTSQAYYCWRKIGGCGESFPPDCDETREIDSQALMQENPDPHDLENTLLKMSAKRSHSGATVQAHACSDEFSQDRDPDDPQVDPEEEADAARFSGKPAERGHRSANSSQDNGKITDARVVLARGKLRERFTSKGWPLAEENLRAGEEVIAGEIQDNASSFADMESRFLDAVLNRIGTFDG